MKQTEISTHATQVNGWFPAVHMSSMSQNFRLFHVSNLSVRNFRNFLLMYTGPAVHMSCMSQNFRLFHVSNLSVRNFRFFCSCIRGTPRARPAPEDRPTRPRSLPPSGPSSAALPGASRTLCFSPRLRGADSREIRPSRHDRGADSGQTSADSRD